MKRDFVKPAQVLHVLGSAEREQAAIVRIVAALAAALDAGRYRLHALFLGGSGPLVATLTEAGVPVQVLHWPAGLRQPWGAWQFWQAARAQRFDLVHVHFGGRSVRYLARWATGAPVLLHLHSRVLEQHGAHPLELPASGADGVIAVSQAIAGAVRGNVLKPRVIHSGVRVPAAQNGAANASPVIGTAARLVPVKGLHVLLRACARLQNDFPDLRLHIAGEGPQLPELRRAAAELGISECVRFLGWQEDMAGVLAGWNVYVNSSVEEGFPLSVLEAMAAGLPVVASRVGGIPEAVVDGRTGWLVRAGDEEILAARIAELLRDGERARQMGAAGRRHVQERFSSAAMVQAISDVYDDLLRARRK